MLNPKTQTAAQVSMKEELDAQVALDVFKYDAEYTIHEKEYEVRRSLGHFELLLFQLRIIKYDPDYTAARKSTRGCNRIQWDASGSR